MVHKLTNFTKNSPTVRWEEGADSRFLPPPFETWSEIIVDTLLLSNVHRHVDIDITLIINIIAVFVARRSNVIHPQENTLH